MRYNKGILTEMMVLLMNRCKSCNTELGEGMSFCPSCGTRQVICPACGQPHLEESRFCSMCGAMLTKAEAEPTVEDDLCATQKIVLPPPAELEREEVLYDDESQRSWYQKNRRPLLLGAIFVILIAVLSSWFFSSQMREDEYQARMVTICADMTAINEDVLRQMDRLDEKNRTQIASHLVKHLEVVQKIKTEQAELRAPKSLSEEQTKVARLLILEEQILSQIEIFCREPLSADPSEGSQMVAEWAKEADGLCRDIALEAPFAKMPSLSRAVGPLHAMMETERKLEEERLKQLAMRKAYIEKMDEIVKEYEAEKGALSSMLERARAGSISSEAYRASVAAARDKRELLRSRVRSLEVPDEAQELTAKLDAALTASLHYCDTMDELANPLLAILQGRDIYAEARSIDRQVQEAYGAFRTQYETYKTENEEPQDSEPNTDTQEEKPAR